MRYWISTLSQAILAPVLILTLLYILQVSIGSREPAYFTDPPAQVLDYVSACSGPKPCITLMYTPSGDSLFDGIMTKFVQLNNKRSGETLFQLESGWSPRLEAPSKSLGVVPVPSQDFMYDYIDQFQNVTSWGVVFSKATTPRVLSGQSKISTDIQYQIWYNSTNNIRLFKAANGAQYSVGLRERFADPIVSMMRQLDEAIIAHLKGDEDLHLDIWTKMFPELGMNPAYICPFNADTVFNTLGPMFLVIPSLVIFFSVLNSIAGEKEKNLKDAMKMIGLQDSIYWISHFLAGLVVVTINTLVLMGVGRAFGFNFFIRVEPGVMFLFFWLFSLATVSMAIFIASISPRIRIAIGLGMFYTLMTLIYITVGQIAGYLWYTEGNNPNVTDLGPVWKTFMFFPFFNYNKMLLDMVQYTTINEIRDGEFRCTLSDAKPFRWQDLYVRPNVTSGLVSKQELVPVPNQSLEFFVMNIFLWLVLGWYLDKITPNDNGYSEHPLFFLFPSFYGFKNPIWLTRRPVRPLPRESMPQTSEDSDVALARQEAVTSRETSDIGLWICGLHKRYYGGLKGFVSWLTKLFGFDDYYLENWPGLFGDSKTAIHELSLTVKKGEMLALLGSNGAGKTSAMKILYGISPASSGEGSAFGLDVQTEMTEIRKILGVCPQFDILFPDLNAEEHVEIFCGIKGIPRDEMIRVREQRLKHMRLWNVRHQRASQYSGGMKRRLSVILSTLGDPKLCLYDEPTTGMDPVNKRYVWSFIEEFKVGRAVILTTHSMEEADVLADKIAIMSKGRLKAIGKSIRLKNKFGDGYRISILVSKNSDVPEIKMRIAELKVQCKLVSEEYIGGAAYQHTDANSAATKKTASVEAGLDKVPEVKFGTTQSARLVYQTSNIDEAKLIIEFLEHLTANLGNAKPCPIASFGMSQTTLEDVFLKTVQNAQ